MNLAPGKENERRAAPRRLSERVALLQQVLPFLLLVVVMFYEVVRHLAFPNAGHPALFAIETVIFGLAGPAALWLTLHWIRTEMRAREAAEGELDLRTRMMLEMHHRIKNNLQTVADLLSLEMTRADGRSAAESLRDSVSRIKSIAAAHDLLSPDQISSADITALAQRVADSAQAAQARADQSIRVQVEGPSIFLPSKSATAFALVVNELVSNALEHGLAPKGSGYIDITLDQMEDEVSVEVKDNGVGLAPGFNLVNSAGLGLRIVTTLVEKDLHGSIRLLKDHGTCAEIHFPISEGIRT
jgi:two-component system, sensor histidine kinase PdtaS